MFDKTRGLWSHRIRRGSWWLPCPSFRCWVVCWAIWRSSSGRPLGSSRRVFTTVGAGSNSISQREMESMESDPGKISMVFWKTTWVWAWDILRWRAYVWRLTSTSWFFTKKTINFSATEISEIRELTFRKTWRIPSWDQINNSRDLTQKTWILSKKNGGTTNRLGILRFHRIQQRENRWFSANGLSWGKIGNPRYVPSNTMISIPHLTFISGRTTSPASFQKCEMFCFASFSMPIWDVEVFHWSRFFCLFRRVMDVLSVTWKFGAAGWWFHSLNHGFRWHLEFHSSRNGHSISCRNGQPVAVWPIGGAVGCD